MTVTIDGKEVKLTGFIWGNFEYGDIVWLEDHDVNLLAAYFVSFRNDVVTLVSLHNDDAILAIKCQADSVHQIIGA